MTVINNWNREVIEEFHAHAGKVGGPFEGKSLLLLTTTGVRSGQRHTTPLAYLPDGNRQIIFASKGVRQATLTGTTIYWLSHT